jgi:hypothetical protein
MTINFAEIKDAGVWDVALTDLEIELLAGDFTLPVDIKPDHLLSYEPIVRFDLGGAEKEVTDGIR